MSSDLFILEGSFFRHSTSPDNITNMACPESELNLQFFSSSDDPFFPFEDFSSSSSNLLHFPTTPPPPPPSQELNNLSLDQTPPPISVPAISTDGVGGNFSVLDALRVKSEENFIGFDSFSPTQLSVLSCNTEKMMQRSFSSHSLDRKPGSFFQPRPRFNSLIEATNLQNQALGSPENGEILGPVRRVCSTGDLQRIKGTQLSSSPLASESSSSFMEESSFKVRRYSAEERKQRIHRYRSKRTQRNFNKTIKYACRKTLADSRPRVRGRFARNDETGEIPKVAGFNRDEEDEEELWGDGFHEEEEDQASMVGAVAATGIFNNFSPSQFQYLKF